MKKRILLIALIILVAFSGTACTWSEVGLPEIDEKLQISSTPYLYDIAEGKIPGHDVWRMNGAAQDIDTAIEAVWSVGDLYTFPSAGMQMEVVSSSNEDAAGLGVNPAGTGVHYVLIVYLDTDWNENTELVALDGTTAVATVATNIYRINNFYTYPLPTIGSSNVSVGDIDLRHISDTPIYSRIPQGFNNQSQAIYTVPEGKAVFVTSIIVSSGSDGGGHFVKSYIETTRGPAGTIEDLFYFGGLIGTQDNAIHIDLNIPGRFPEHTDIQVLAVADNVVSNVEVAVEYIGWIEIEEDG